MEHLVGVRGGTIVQRDSQVVELLGRNRLIEELLLAGMGVALPFRDGAIDLIAYADLAERVENFAARLCYSGCVDPNG